MRGVPATPWTDAERDTLRRLWASGSPRKTLIASLGRSEGSIRRQVAALHLPARHWPAGQAANPPPPKAAAPTIPRAGKTTLPPLPSLADDAA